MKNMKVENFSLNLNFLLKSIKSASYGIDLLLKNIKGNSYTKTNL